MNVNQIVNMAIRIVMRKAMSRGINMGIKTASNGFKKRSPKSDLPPTGPRKNPENYSPSSDLPDMDQSSGGRYSGSDTPNTPR